MRLTDLDPRWVGEGVESGRSGMGITLNCPCGCDEALYVPFANPIDGGPPTQWMRGSQSGYTGWQREGETFDTLTLRPSILRIKFKGQDGKEHGCGWHGFITNGEVVPA